MKWEANIQCKSSVALHINSKHLGYILCLHLQYSQNMLILEIFFKSSQYMLKVLVSGI